MTTIFKNSTSRDRLIRFAAILTFSVALVSAQTSPSPEPRQPNDPPAPVALPSLSGSYLVSISLQAEPGVAYPGLVTYSSEGTVIANEAVDFTGTPLAGATITEDHGTWKSIGGNRFIVTFVKMAMIGGKYAYTVTTRAIVEADGHSFQGTYNLDIRDVNNAPVIPGGLNGSITGTAIAAEAPPQS